MRLKDKVAVVTRVDAGSIAQATAILFAKEGARVVLLGGGEQDGIETAALIRKGGGDSLLLNLDISKELEVEQACEDILRAFGGLDILVNNDGVFAYRGLDATIEDWQNSLKANVISGTTLIGRYAADAMKRQKKGAIVNVVTLSGPLRQSAACSTAPAAVMQMTSDMSVDLAPDNIRVNCVSHRDVQSATSHENIGRGEQIAEEFLASESAKDLLNRTGKPREVAYAILFLASDEASFITGTHLVVDGGHYSPVKPTLQQQISARVASFS